MSATGILPTEIEGWVDREIRPGVWLITNPKFQPQIQKWTALANVGGALAVVHLRAFIDKDFGPSPLPQLGGARRR